jgi:hypothetical protein
MVIFSKYLGTDFSEFVPQEDLLAARGRSSRVSVSPFHSSISFSFSLSLSLSLVLSLSLSLSLSLALSSLSLLSLTLFLSPCPPTEPNCPYELSLQV